VPSLDRFVLPLIQGENSVTRLHYGIDTEYKNWAQAELNMNYLAYLRILGLALAKRQLIACLDDRIAQKGA